MLGRIKRNIFPHKQTFEDNFGNREVLGGDTIHVFGAPDEEGRRKIIFPDPQFAGEVSVGEDAIEPVEMENE